MPKGEIVGIDVFCSVIDALLVGIGVILVAWVAGELVSTCMFGFKWIIHGWRVALVLACLQA